jgi:hypothetical protein
VLGLVSVEGALDGRSDGCVVDGDVDGLVIDGVVDGEVADWSLTSMVVTIFRPSLSS